MLTKELFLKAFPHADLGVFEVDPTSVKFLYQRKKYDVFVDRIGRGEPLRHYSADIQRELNLALGTPWRPTPKFPQAFTITDKKYSIPAIPFSEHVDDIRPLLTQLRLWVSDKDSFTVTMPDVFDRTQLSFHLPEEIRKWNEGPDFHFYPQLLNLCIWCATSGCGVSLIDPTLKTWPPQVQGLLHFHVYYTTRRLLFEVSSRLPLDDGFDPKNNSFSKSALYRIFNEFGLPTTCDFRWKGGPNPLYQDGEMLRTKLGFLKTYRNKGSDK